MFGDPVFVPVRVLVGLRTPDSSRPFGCTLDSSRHFRTPLHSTHLTIKVPPPLSWFCEPAPIFLTGGLIKSIYSHTVSAFLSWQTVCENLVKTYRKRLINCQCQQRVYNKVLRWNFVIDQILIFHHNLQINSLKILQCDFVDLFFLFCLS